MTEASAPLESQAVPHGPVAVKPASEAFTHVLPRRIARLVVVVQSILLWAHGFLYATWVALHPALPPPTPMVRHIALLIAAVSFVAATPLAWRYFNSMVPAFYIISAVCVGLATLC